MFLDEALAMVRNCPTEGAIADMLAAEGIVAIPTEASQCALAEFFMRCDGVYLAEVYGNDENVGEALIRLGPTELPFLYSLTEAAYSFIIKFDQCAYPKLVHQDIVDVFDMYRGLSLKFNKTTTGLVMRVFHYPIFGMVAKEFHYVNVNEDGSVDFTLRDH